MGYRHKKEGALSLLPFLIFIVIYLGAGIYFQIHGVEMAFYQFPSVTAMFIAVLSAFFMGDETLQVKFGIFSRGAGNENVMTMLMIYILAGAFSAVAAAMGGRDATVNLGISFVPAQYLTAGIFIISAFMGTATGTSMGTIAAIVPIAAGISVKSGISEALMVAACVGGAMFGDNLSMISDTTIAATRTQGCELKDKFKMNFRIALPAAVLTIFLLLVIGQPSAAADLQELDYSLLKVFPYIAVLGLALLGANVFLVLTAGIFLAGFIGMASAELTVITFAQNIWNGFMGMGEAFFLALFCGGISEMIAYYGGIEWLISKLRKMIKGNKSAQLGIAALVSLTDCATANNTVAIIISGGVAKDISNEYGIDSRRSASLLDIFSCVFQGIIPYGAQLLTASALASKNGAVINAMEIIPHMWYCWLLAIFGILSIYIPYAYGGRYEPNPSLKPETTTNWELGIKKDLGKTKISADLFYARTKDYIDLVTIGKTAKGADIKTYKNVGEARTHGAELSVTHKFSSLWSVYANYTWQLGKVADADNGYAMGRDYEIPRHLFHSGVTYTNHPWTVNVDSMFVSARNEPGWKSGKFESRDAYFLLNMDTAYAVNKNLSVQFSIYNILDREYYDQESASDKYYVGDGRTFTLSARYSF